jgi:hypothetical protein
MSRLRRTWARTISARRVAVAHRARVLGMPGDRKDSEHRLRTLLRAGATGRSALEVTLPAESGMARPVSWTARTEQIGSSPGDLEIAISRAASFFNREGDDIVCSVPITTRSPR